MRLAAAAILPLTFVGSLFAETSPSDAYFPWEKGTEWVYKTTRKAKPAAAKTEEKEGESGEPIQQGQSFDMHVVMEGPWEEKGLSGMIMTQKDKRGRMREFLVRNEKGIFIYKLGLKKSISPELDTRFLPPVPRVIYPLEPEARVHWEGRLKVAWVDKPIVFDGEVIGLEEITVPAGTFKCIKLYYHEKRGEEVLDEYAWYAEGVGQVKYDGGQWVKELKEIRRHGDAGTR